MVITILLPTVSINRCHRQSCSKSVKDVSLAFPLPTSVLGDMVKLGLSDVLSSFPLPHESGIKFRRILAGGGPATMSMDLEEPAASHDTSHDRTAEHELFGSSDESEPEPERVVGLPTSHFRAPAGGGPSGPSGPSGPAPAGGGPSGDGPLTRDIVFSHCNVAFVGMSQPDAKIIVGDDFFARHSHSYY